MRQSYITIQSWMRESLDLSGNELIAYAVIYGFSQDGESRFSGSRQYIADWCGCSVRNVQNILNSLIERGYITKYENTKNSQRICEYAANFTPSEKISPPGEKISLNNIANNIDIEEESNSINRITPENDCNSHGYSFEELKAEFLGSKKKSSKPTLYSKCVDEICSYTDDYNLRQVLTDYLVMRLSVKDKPIRGVNQWKGMLNKLNTLQGDKYTIVNQSLERGWLAFYPISNNSRSKFSEGDGLSCEKSTTTAEERKRILEEKGLRSEF